MANDAENLTDVVNAPVDKVIDALTDFETFPEWQSAVIETEVLDRDSEGRGSRVRMKVDAKIRKVEYIVKYSYDLPNRLSWEQESGDLKENTGVYSFAPRADGGSDRYGNHRRAAGADGDPAADLRRHVRRHAGAHRQPLPCDAVRADAGQQYHQSEPGLRRPDADYPGHCHPHADADADRVGAGDHA